MLKVGLTTDNFLGIHEQSAEKEIQKGRRVLLKGKFCYNQVLGGTPILLTTERFWHYRRLHYTGAMHVIFVGAPSNPLILWTLLRQSIQAPFRVDGEKGDESRHLCIIYWDHEYETDQIERITGINKIPSIAQANGKLVSLTYI